MTITFSKLLPFLSILPAAFADYWSVDFYESDDCTGTSPAGFGDSVPYGCTPINTDISLGSATANYDGNFKVYVYETTDCSETQGVCYPLNGCRQGAWVAFMAVN